MKSLFITIALAFPFYSYADGSSLLDTSANVTGFGEIKYRAPIVEGDENPIVLVHGIYGGASHRTWRKLLPLLDAAGKRVYILDLPGAGESDKPRREYSIEVFDVFLERFLEEVVKERASVVSESILSNATLRVSSTRPDLIRRAVIINPSGMFSLVDPPSDRENEEYERFLNDDEGLIRRYQSLLEPNSIRFFLRFSFFDDALVNESLIDDFSVLQGNLDQRFLTLSFITGRLYRSFEESAEGVFIPVMGVFGSEYEAFQENRIARASDFKNVRPDFKYIEIEGSGSSVQREKPEALASEIIKFTELD